MTHVRRFLTSPLALIAIGGLLTGCAGSRQFSAGRLPYGGDSKMAAQDPFAGVSGDQRVADAAGRSSVGAGQAAPFRNRELTSWNRDQPVATNEVGTRDDYSAPPSADSQWRREPAAPASHQTAYFEQAADNPFATSSSPQMTSQTSPPMTASPSGGIQQMSYSEPATTSNNPFADVEGQPATGSTTTVSPTDTWTTEASAPAEEVFLPPIR